MPGLGEVQRAFAVCMLERSAAAPAWILGDAITAADRLRVYRNNSQAAFEQALQLTYPVLRRRVGPEYWRQVARRYQRAHPSRTGDLHDTGHEFADFLAADLAGTPYAWLAELAALEWAVADAGIATTVLPATPASLAALSPEQIEFARFDCVPSLRLVLSAVPVLTVWRANQPEQDGAPVDLAAGAECVVIHRNCGSVVLRAVERAEFRFIIALARGAALGAALEESQLPFDDLPVVLHRLFMDEVIASIAAA